MALSSYINSKELYQYIMGGESSSIDRTTSKIMSTKINGIEALPYQFMETVDRRIPNTEVGRKYGEKIFSRLPLLFLTPCEPLFMDDFDKASKLNGIDRLLNSVGGGNVSDLTTTSGKYYSVDFDYDEYYKYLNTMLAALTVYLNIYDKKVTIAGSKTSRKLGQISWQNELSDSFKSFFSSKENIIFYLDGMNSVSESFSNGTTESSLASQVNQFSDTANELKFLFGSNGNVAATLLNSTTETTSAITSALSSVASGLAGGIVGSLADNGVNSVLRGGKITFPKIWSDSSFDRSYSINIKLRSPDHDNLSIFLNVLKPYCKLLCLCLPRQLDAKDDGSDSNSYGAPFLVKAYSKGLFNIDMGMITSMSVTKGDTCCWNDDGLPTQIDISLEITDLYSHMAMSKIDIGTPVKSIKSVCRNTTYMDFIANMAGLNIAQMEVGRRIAMAYYLTQTMVSTAGSALFTRFDRSVSRLIGRLNDIV